MAVDRVPSLGGAQPVKLNLRFSLPAAKDSLADDLRELFLRGACCDTVLVCAGRRFPAHRAALAARSAVLREEFATQTQTQAAPEAQSQDCVTPSGPAAYFASASPQRSSPARGSGTVGAAPGREMRVSAASNPEAVEHLLHYVYELPAAEGASLEIVKDVLRLADVFKLPGLAQRASQWLAKDVTTADAVERLAVCRDFGLTALRQRLLETLHANRAALSEIVSSSKVLEYPELMQELLQQVAGPQTDDNDDDEHDDEPCSPSKKWAKKGGGKGGGRGVGSRGGGRGRGRGGSR